MTYESHDNDNTTDQKALERLAMRAQSERIIREHDLAAQRGNFSSSGYGRKLVSGEHGDTGILRVAVLAELIKEVAYGKNVAGVPELRSALEAIDAAHQITPPKGVQRYGSSKTTGAEVFALIALRTAVDYCAVIKNDKGLTKWTPFAAVVQKLGDRLHLQMLDAECWLLNAAEHQKQAGRWNRKHQGAKNKRTNLQLGQRAIVGEFYGLDLDTDVGKEKARERLAEFKWSEVQLQDVGKIVLDRCLMQIDVLELVPITKVGKMRKDVQRVKPTDALIEAWGREVLPQLTKDRIIQLPMVASPQPWSLATDADGKPLPGSKNTTGGYHRDSLKLMNPLVRQHNGNTRAVPSKQAIDLVNTLGATGYTTDDNQIAAFAWAVDHQREECGVPVMPLITIADLDAETRQNKLDIDKHGCVFVDGEPCLRETPEHDVWKAKRKQAYDHAIDAQSKYIRTAGIRAGLSDLQDQQALHYSWSFDSRLRVYPQQAALIHPQGTSVERTLLKFQQGQRVEKGSDAYREVVQAIGTSWKGDKCSHAARFDHGVEALSRFQDDITASDPADLSVLISNGAKEPWALLQQLREYDTAINNGGLWRVPLGIDASQSGLQILSALLLDTSGMEATNLILPADYQSTDGPTDGYRKVAEYAVKLLPKQRFSDASKLYIEQLLSGGNARSLSKAVVLPLPYGSTIEGSRKAVRKSIQEDLGIKSLAEHVQGPDAVTRWKLAEEVINDLTKLLRAAAARVYPAAMSALLWLEKLAGKAFDRQINADIAQPYLEWSLSDGSLISFNRQKILSRPVHTVNGKMLRLAGGDDPFKADRKRMVRWMAPSAVHAFDALLLRLAFSDWGNDRPLQLIHDCVATLPAELPETRTRIKSAFKTMVRDNSLEAIATDLKVEMTPLKKGNADLDKIDDSVFMFH